jgi:hypothetical protein
MIAGGTVRVRAVARAQIALVVILLAACTVAPEPTERVRPTPTPGPPALRFSASTGGTFDGRIWTISVIVEPKGLPTDVELEYHPGLEDGPFDFVIPVAEDVLDVGRVSTQTTDLPVDQAFCYRFTATNELGAASTDPFCFPGPPSFAPSPSGPLVTPSPAAS